MNKRDLEKLKSIIKNNGDCVGIKCIDCPLFSCLSNNDSLEQAKEEIKKYNIILI